MKTIATACFAAGILAAALPRLAAATYDVKSFGATGDGRTIDSPAINRAIDAAAAHGGGTVVLPSGGTYASYSIHLQSNVTLVIEAGATLLAAEPKLGAADSEYDPPEPNSPNDEYEDFGHSHWHNSLIWGERLHDVEILGPGRIYGFGLSRGAHGRLRDQTPEERRQHIPAPAAPLATTGPKGPFGYPNPKDSLPAGIGDKAIALKECANVILRDLTIYHGGHFGILATGDDNLSIENLTIDTNRDGMDIDSCRDVRVDDCIVNSPYDDGICLKADYALGRLAGCDNVAVTNCQVSGFVEGTVIAGTYREGPPNFDPTGRIKLGTEATGGYRNIVISNCTFDYCRGLALEEVDGAAMDDIAITNLTMRHIANSAIYVRLGERNRGPEGTTTGEARRIVISNVIGYDIDPRYSSIIAGSPGHDIEGLTLSNIRLEYRGGGTAAWARKQPPELLRGYPEPRYHGIMPAYGFFIRHVRDVAFHDIDLSTEQPDARPPFVLEDVAQASFDRIRAEHEAGVPVFVLHQVSDFENRGVVGMPDSP